MKSHKKFIWTLLFLRWHCIRIFFQLTKQSSLRKLIFRKWCFVALRIDIIRRFIHHNFIFSIFWILLLDNYIVALLFALKGRYLFLLKLFFLFKATGRYGYNLTFHLDNFCRRLISYLWSLLFEKSLWVFINIFLRCGLL